MRVCVRNLALLQRRGGGWKGPRSCLVHVCIWAESLQLPIFVHKTSPPSEHTLDDLYRSNSWIDTPDEVKLVYAEITGSYAR